MTFTILPEELTGLFKSLSKARRDDTVILSARRDRVSVYSKAMIASINVPVEKPGQCYVSRSKLTGILKTFPSLSPVAIRHAKGKLQIGTFAIDVAPCSYSEVPRSQRLSPPKNKPAVLRGGSDSPGSTPSNSNNSNGYSPLHVRDEHDYLGKAGLTEPNDGADPYRPVICPVCESVGYFKKYLYRGNTYRSHSREWASKDDALEIVLLSGEEKERLCPHCLAVRFGKMSGNDAAEATQQDMFTGSAGKPRSLS